VTRFYTCQNIIKVISVELVHENVTVSIALLSPHSPQQTSAAPPLDLKKFSTFFDLDRLLVLSGRRFSCIALAFDRYPVKNPSSAPSGRPWRVIDCFGRRAINLKSAQ
jgi:hypothetical protein